jgi:hypothetical protein
MIFVRVPRGTMARTSLLLFCVTSSVCLAQVRDVLCAEGDGKFEAEFRGGIRPGGDQQMLEYTQGGDGARLMLLLHHGDAVREYVYGAESKVGTFSDALMAEARQRGWIVVSMKNDWNRIFRFDQ